MSTEVDEDVQATIHRIADKATRLHPDDYDDAVQEGMTAAWLAGGPPGQQVVAARSAVLNLVRGRRSVTAPRGGPRRYEPREKTILDERDHLTSHDDVVDRLDIERALAKLPERDRELVRLRFLEDRPPEEVAARLGLKPNSVRARWVRVIRPRLRELLAA